MFDFFMPKNKIKAHIIRDLDLKDLSILGISQINQQCKSVFEGNVLISVVTFINETIKYDEREALVLSDYFELRKCPKCNQVELFPTKLKINMYPEYLKNEESVAHDAYSEYPSKINTPTLVEAYCKSCNSAFEIRIKNKDLWIKQAKKLKDTDIIGSWDEYLLDKE